jgi:Mn2+/Fe2+ NRAMP family transporter
MNEQLLNLFLIFGVVFFAVGTASSLVIGWIAFGLLTGRLKWHSGSSYW